MRCSNGAPNSGNDPFCRDFRVRYPDYVFLKGGACETRVEHYSPRVRSGALLGIDKVKRAGSRHCPAAMRTRSPRCALHTARRFAHYAFNVIINYVKYQVVPRRHRSAQGSGAPSSNVR